MEENPKIFMIERFRLQKSCWLVKVIDTATGGEALILQMYTNYFDGAVCIGEPVFELIKFILPVSIRICKNLTEFAQNCNLCKKSNWLVFIENWEIIKQ